MENEKHYIEKVLEVCERAILDAGLDWNPTYTLVMTPVFEDGD